MNIRGMDCTSNLDQLTTVGLGNMELARMQNPYHQVSLDTNGSNNMIPEQNHLNHYLVNTSILSQQRPDALLLQHQGHRYHSNSLLQSPTTTDISQTSPNLNMEGNQ